MEINLKVKSTNDEDNFWIQQALSLAEKGIYMARPNPRVGCVIVNNGEVVGEGFHLQQGEPHAEIIALSQAGEKAKGATCYVTLEPCAHYGKTGPCSKALIKSGVSRVVFAMEDPNPLVAGKGAAHLLEAGIEVTTDVLKKKASELNAGFIKRMVSKHPYVRIKLASSLDGNIAAADGKSKWLSSKLSRQDVQRFRARSCAVITGSTTVLKDDPSLNVRDFDALAISSHLYSSVKQPLRVIVDSKAITSTNIKMLKLSGETILATTCNNQALKEQWNNMGGTWLQLDCSNGKVSLTQLLDYLGQRQCNEVLVESGADLCGAFTEQGLVDEYVIYMSPKILGNKGKSMLTLNNILSFSEHKSVTFKDVTPIAGDLRIRATVKLHKIQ